MGLLDEICDVIVAVRERISRLEHRKDNAIIEGVVVQRDLQKGIRARIGGTDAAPMLSPWIKPPDHSGTTAFLPPIGAKVMFLAPGGHIERAAFIPHGHSDDKPNPATNQDEVVLLNWGNVRIAALNGTLTITCGGSTYAFAASGFEQTGGTHKHDGKNIGKDHHHGGVTPGSGQTGDPVG